MARYRPGTPRSSARAPPPVRVARHPWLSLHALDTPRPRSRSARLPPLRHRAMLCPRLRIRLDAAPHEQRVDVLGDTGCLAELVIFLGPIGGYDGELAIALGAAHASKSRQQLVVVATHPSQPPDASGSAVVTGRLDQHESFTHVGFLQ